MTGIWTSDTSSDSMTCVLWDKRLLTHTSHIAYIYAQFQKSLSDVDSNFINSSGVAQFSSHQKLLIGCSTQGDTGTVRVAQPITFTFHKIAANVKHGTPTTVTKSVTRRELNGR